MKLKHLLLTTLFLIFPFPVYADIVGVYMGGGIWNHSASGTARDATSTINFDLENDMHFEDEQDGYFYIAIEHPLPLIPNVRFASNKLSHDGSGLTTVQVDIGGQSFPASTNIVSNLTFDTTDFTLYYEILDNVVELDLGITARKLDASFVITDGATTATETLDETIPLLYGAVAFNLPITGLSFIAEGNFVGSNDVNYSDYLVKIRYELVSVLGIEGGYRNQNIEIDDSSVTADMKFSGIFAGVFVHF